VSDNQHVISAEEELRADTVADEPGREPTPDPAAAPREGEDVEGRLARLEEELADACATLASERLATQAREQGLNTAIAALGESLRQRESELTSLREEAEAEVQRIAAELGEARTEAEATHEALEQTTQDLQRVRAELHAIRPGGAAIKEKLREAERRQNIETRKALQRTQEELHETRLAVEARQRRIGLLENALRNHEKETADALAQRDTEIEKLRQTGSAAQEREIAQRARAEELTERLESTARDLADSDRRAREIAASHAQIEPRLRAAEAERDDLRSATQSLEDDLAQQREAATSSAARLADTEDALRQSRARLSVLERELENGEAARNELDLARRHAEQEADELRAHLQARDDQLREAKERAAALSDQERGLRSEADVLRDRCAALEEEKGALRAELRQVQAAGDTSDERAKTQALESEAEAGRLREEVRELTARCRSLAEEAATLREAADVQARQAATDREQQTAAITRYEAEAGRLREEIGDLTARCRSLAEAAATVREAADLQARQAATDREQQATVITRYEAELADLRQRTNETPPPPDDVLDRVSELDAQVAEREMRCRQLSELIAEMKRRHENELADARQQIEESTERSDGLVARVAELETQLAEREARCKHLAGQINAAGRILDRLREQREALRAQLAAAGPHAPPASSR